MWGFIDKNGNEVIPFIYNDTKIFKEGLAGVKLNNKWGFIDKNGSEVIQFKYDDVWCFFEGGLALVEKDNKWGFISKEGLEIIPIKYDEITYFDKGLAMVHKVLSEKQICIARYIVAEILGYIDKNGTEYWEE